ncbi:replication-relaxation family protein, partial [Streptomyces minutiscleroticus]|uniref:replication-relaxation family protein n=1 Tax=Streptomyces minutiscleroticus TaxID=68238 RepID=UPI0033320445
MTDTLAALLQTPPEPMLPGPRTPTAPDAAPRVLAERPPGLGPLTASTTEVTLPVAGTFASPARGFLRADLVYALPGARPELLFVEVDNGTESPEVLADKVARYAAFFKRPADSRRPAHASTGPALWHTVWPHAAPEDRRRLAHPPVAVVFTKDTGPEALRNRMTALGRLSHALWKGVWHRWPRPSEIGGEDGYQDFAGRIPLLATSLRL